MDSKIVMLIIPGWGGGGEVGETGIKGSIYIAMWSLLC